ncbi:EF-hand domain pair [Phytophthora cinnamomi]|uniref:EF-hand domain pair n=1 Tax=Phytophthora cinnamomi TaxID=4785 RepID=UPI00355A1E69|nr:EF-hand domain pair [Phytophthora cinnamomi]
MRDRKVEQREHEREAVEEYLLEQMQHSDSYNDGKLLVEVFRETMEAMELNPRVAPREVLLALATSDRDDMVAYGEFVSVAADMIDTMSGDGYASGGEQIALCADEEDEALDAFEVVSARQTHYTVEKLEVLLEAHAERVAEAANAMAARRAAAELETQQDIGIGILEETKESENEEDEEAEHETSQAAESTADGAPNDTSPAAEDDDAGMHSTSRRRSSTGRRGSSAKQHPRMTRHQLRGFLETPQLLLSEAEINLTLALAETKTNPNGIEEVLCEKLGPLLRRVRRLIFRFQRKGFIDRVEKYLLHQFQSFEKRALQGASKHLKQRLTQKEVKAAVKGMEKLLLSPYQLMQLVALTEERVGSPDHAIYYQEIIPQLAEYLRELVNVTTLSEKSELLHEMGVWDFASMGLPSENVVRQASYDCFESFDPGHSGVISIADFHEALKQLAQSHGLPVGTMAEMKQLSALADPTGNGRVNYAFCQHLMYPLLLSFLQEREVAAARDGTRKRHDEVGLESA